MHYVTYTGLLYFNKVSKIFNNMLISFSQGSYTISIRLHVFKIIKTFRQMRIYFLIAYVEKQIKKIVEIYEISC